MSRLLSSRRTMLVAAGAVTILVLAATMVTANHQFTDVPNSAYYHDAVDWIKDHNITAGCNQAGTKYCPTSNVTRGDMAIFLKKTHELAPAVATATDDGTQTFNTGTLTDVTGAAATVTVPSGQTARLVITFASESICYGGDPGEYSWCKIRFLRNGGVFWDEDFAYDSTDFGSETDGSWGAHSITVTGTVGAGSHTIQVQAAGFFGTPNPTLAVDDWTLVVERYIL